MRNLFKYAILVVILLLPSTFINSQTNTTDLSDSIFINFMRQMSLYPQEKIYVQNDKPYYITGEDIWFRVHLVDAGSNIPDTTSRYIYSELIDPMDSVVIRAKVRPIDGAHHGYFNIPEELPEGDYTMRFYTRFMEGRGENYFFKKKVSIGTPLSALYRTETTFNYEDGNKKVNIELRFIDTQTNTPIEPENIHILDDKGNRRNIKLNDESIGKTSLKVPNDKGKYLLFVEYDYAGKFHKQFILIPPPDDFDVSFFPEGGKLPTSIQTRIAFKALNSSGMGEDITGAIVSEKGDTLNYFESSHLGMGSFFFYGNENEKYYAICKNTNNLEKRFELPPFEPNSIALNTIWQKDKLYIKLIKSASTPLPESPYIIIHSKGNVIYAGKWDITREYIVMKKEELPSGVIQILLTDGTLTPLSERLVFNIDDRDFAKTSFTTNKNKYNKRELVDASVNIFNSEERPLTGNFSVAITDDKDIILDKKVNILSTLLLTSELRGNIETPAYYFEDDDAKRKINLDFLMMTQGWRRYNVENVLKGIYERPTSYLELGPSITGSIKGGILMNKASEGYPITAVSILGGVFDYTVSDAKGKFIFNLPEFSDSSAFIIQAKTKKGGNRVELIIDPETFPNIEKPLPLSLIENRNSFENYMNKADQQYALVNGMRMIYLKDVEVTAKRVEKKGKSIFSSAFNTLVTSEEIEKMHALDIYAVLSRIAGIWVTGTNISIRGSEAPPLIMIDGIEVETDYLQSLMIDDVDEVEVAKGAQAAIFGSRGGGGAIMITTKRGFDQTARRSERFNFKEYKPLGHQTAKEFYSPKYETREQINNPNPDMRSTIYWNPNVKIGENGKANFNFYTADIPTTYSVVIEGVSADGKLIRKVEKIVRED